MKNALTVLMCLAVAAPVFSQDAATDPEKAKILNKLDSMRISVDFAGVTLDEALSFIRDFSNLNLVVDAGVYEKYSPDDLKVTIKVKELLLKSVLKLMLNTRDLTATYREGVLLIVTKEKIHSTVTTQVYDARDLLFKIRDFPGPKVELTAPGAGGTPLTGATFTLDEEPKSTITEEFLVDMVQQNTGGGAWDENPNASITMANGLLIITQSPRVHGEIKRILQLLRQYK